MAAITEKVADAVNSVTTALSNATIQGGEDKNANQDAVLASAAEGRRLYIGNLAYATTEAELKDFFNGYLIESISIPKNPRTERPVGYAFVDLSTPSEADRAIAELSGKEVLERKVSVQLARKPDANDKADATSGNEAGSGGEGRQRRTNGRGRGRGRGRGGRGGQVGRGSRGEEGAEKPLDGQVLPLTDTTNSHAANDQDNKTRDGKERAPRQPRERRERGPPADGIASKTKVMVANLPYDYSEEKLKELFEAYQPSAAKLALRPIPRFMVKKLQARNEPRKGRGFGFVTLGSEELQQKAVSEMNGKDIEGREIAVKVAIDSPDKTDEEANAPPAEGAATTNGAVEATA